MNFIPEQSKESKRVPYYGNATKADGWQGQATERTYNFCQNRSRSKGLWAYGSGKVSENFGTLYSIEWHGCNRPENYPQILAEMFIIGHSSKPPSEIANFPYSLGGGYSLTQRHVPPPHVSLKPEILARIRKQRLERRIRAKTPMFAEQFIAEEIEKKSDYYNKGKTNIDVEKDRDEVLKDELSKYNRYFSHAGQLIVYANEPEECKSKAEMIRIEIENLKSRNSNH